MRVDRALAGGALAAWLTLSALYREGAATPPCPFKLTFGFDCPGCGATRAGAKLLHGDVVGAADHNLLVVAAVVVSAAVAVVALVRSVAVRRGVAESTGAGGAYVSAALSAWWSRRRAVVFAGVIAVFEVARLVPVAPFTFLAST